MAEEFLPKPWTKNDVLQHFQIKKGSHGEAIDGGLAFASLEGNFFLARSGNTYQICELI